ncbi:MAG: citrate synthase [Clostridia bacterium]|nr:citrate synthase [Clostridia bacterium]
MEALGGKAEPGLINNLCDTFRENTQINPAWYAKYGIKRGLRNADGTGVLAGMTRISNVHGYVLNEGEREPIEGRLTYRGIDLYNLLDGISSENRFGYCEVAYLLICGRLPTAHQLQTFGQAISESRDLPANFTEDVLMRAPSPDIMNKLAYATLALYASDPNPDDTSVENIMRQGISLIARFPVIISHAYQAKRRYFDNASMYLHVPDKTKSTAENILGLIRPDGVYTAEEAHLLDRCLVIHAEHGGGNNSAFAARVASSSGTDTYSAIAAAVGALKGPRHGGANHKVIQMFDDIKAHVTDWTDEDAVYDYLLRILRREVNDHSGLIYGMGHAVYTLSDPRAVALKKGARPLAEQKGYLKEFELIERVEKLTARAMAQVRGGLDKPICANVDLYSGLVYRMLGIPEELFTPLFATARVIGWMAHRMEEITTGGKIIRPAYKPLKHEKRFYVPLSARE